MTRRKVFALVIALAASASLWSVDQGGKIGKGEHRSAQVSFGGKP
jgi:hypothetical protein